MMTFSIKRVNAIFIKDWKDLQRNSYVIFTLAIPLVFAAWLGRIGEDNVAMSLHIQSILLLLLQVRLFKRQWLQRKKRKIH